MDYEKKALELYRSIRDDSKVRNIKGSQKLYFAHRLQQLCYESEQQGMLEAITKEYVLSIIPDRGRMSFVRMDKAITDMRDARFETAYNEESLKIKIIELFKKGKSDTDIMELLKDIRKGDTL